MTVVPEDKQPRSPCSGRRPETTDRFFEIVLRLADRLSCRFMVRSNRHRLHRLLRNSSLLLLLLCVIGQPVLAAWGEMHELTAHSSATALGLDHHDAVHSDIATDAIETGQSDDPAHALSHHTHCCGQPQLPFVSPLSISACALPSMMLWPTKLRPTTASSFATPFRPPIPG